MTTLEDETPQDVAAGDDELAPVPSEGGSSPEGPTPEGMDPEVVAEDAAPPTIEEQLAAARQETTANFENWLRAKADLENMRKRHQRELTDRARYDGEDLARDVISAVDDLERALGHAEEGGSAIASGVELVLKALLVALKRNGVEKMEAEGKLFDPAEHEAVAMIETEEQPPNTVVAVFRAGYKMRDRLLRAAMVSVSKASAADS